jgi:acetolactate decarboxylase
MSYKVSGLFTVLAPIILVLGGCSGSNPSALTRTERTGLARKIEARSSNVAAVDHDQITQISVINALMVGRYDGVVPISELLKYGDFGIGTLDHLDGELIIFEGKVYQIRADGQIVEVDPKTTTPFAVATPFDKDGDFPCPEVASLTALESHLFDKLPQLNNFLALRIDAELDTITMRSVKRQEPPYKPLAEVARSQSVWTVHNVKGTMIGLRSPSWVTGLNVPGYHWHFLSSDHKSGGHILDCKIRAGTVQFDLCDNWFIKLETTPDFNLAKIGQDLSKELHKVESSRGDDKH